MNYSKNKNWVESLLYLFQNLNKNKYSSTTMGILNELKTSRILSGNGTFIRLHPNPVTDHFHITGLEDTALLTVSDLHCRVMFTKRIIENEQISVSVLPRGVFIAKISTADFTIERKLEKKT